MNARKLANGLGWFSIGLGLIEVIGAEKLAPKIGLAHRVGLVRLFGLREIAQGIAILTSARKEPFVWVRVAGDALDLGVLAEGLFSKKSSSRTGAAIAAGNVAAVTAADIACGAMLT